MTYGVRNNQDVNVFFFLPWPSSVIYTKRLHTLTCYLKKSQLYAFLPRVIAGRVFVASGKVNRRTGKGGVTATDRQTDAHADKQRRENTKRKILSNQKDRHMNKNYRQETTKRNGVLSSRQTNKQARRQTKQTNI